MTSSIRQRWTDNARDDFGMIVTPEERGVADAALREFVVGHTESRWWIDHRDDGWRVWLKPIIARMMIA